MSQLVKALACLKAAYRANSARTMGASAIAAAFLMPMASHAQAGADNQELGHLSTSKQEAVSSNSQVKANASSAAASAAHNAQPKSNDAKASSDKTIVRIPALNPQLSYPDYIASEDCEFICIEDFTTEPQQSKKPFKLYEHGKLVNAEIEENYEPQGIGETFWSKAAQGKKHRSVFLPQIDHGLQGRYDHPSYEQNNTIAKLTSKNGSIVSFVLNETPYESDTAVVAATNVIKIENKAKRSEAAKRERVFTNIPVTQSDIAVAQAIAGRQFAAEQAKAKAQAQATAKAEDDTKSTTNVLAKARTDAAAKIDAVAPVDEVIKSPRSVELAKAQLDAKDAARNAFNSTLKADSVSIKVASATLVNNHGAGNPSMALTAPAIAGAQEFKAKTDKVVELNDENHHEVYEHELNALFGSEALISIFVDEKELTPDQYDALSVTDQGSLVVSDAGVVGYHGLLSRNDDGSLQLQFESNYGSEIFSDAKSLSQDKDDLATAKQVNSSSIDKLKNGSPIKSAAAVAHVAMNQSDSIKKPKESIADSKLSESGSIASAKATETPMLGEALRVYPSPHGDFANSALSEFNVHPYNEQGVAGQYRTDMVHTPYDECVELNLSGQPIEPSVFKPLVPTLHHGPFSSPSLTNVFDRDRQRAEKLKENTNLDSPNGRPDKRPLRSVFE